jgi:hypothetical protein
VTAAREERGRGAEPGEPAPAEHTAAGALHADVRYSVIARAIGAGAVAGAIGFVRLNAKLSLAHRNRIRRVGRYGIRHWVGLTITCDEPSSPSPRWLRRAFRFPRAAVHDADEFSDTHPRHQPTTVHHRGSFYVLDIEDNHLACYQRW